jgi:hypothetical protein
MHNWILLLLIFWMPSNDRCIPISGKIKGLSFVAIPSPFQDNPFHDITDVSANYISVIPFAYTLQNDTEVHYNSHRQWWGEKPEGVRSTIRLAHDHNINVMLKPQIYVPGSWIGDLTFDNEADWIKWEGEYQSYIMAMAEIAADEDVAILCLGTELKRSVVERTSFWIELITKIRTVYCGKLTYSSNWDHYKQIPFWDQLDYIGISTYFPLSDSKTPQVSELIKAWQPIKHDLKTFSLSHNKRMLFTEFGYLSVDHCAHKTWELEADIHQANVNEKAQANALNAIFETFFNEDFWAGGFLWKWFPNGHGHEGYPDKDYTPQNKLAEGILHNWYSK